MGIDLPLFSRFHLPPFECQLFSIRAWVMPNFPTPGNGSAQSSNNSQTKFSNYPSSSLEKSLFFFTLGRKQKVTNVSLQGKLLTPSLRLFILRPSLIREPGIAQDSVPMTG